MQLHYEEYKIKEIFIYHLKTIIWFSKDAMHVIHEQIRFWHTS